MKKELIDKVTKDMNNILELHKLSSAGYDAIIAQKTEQFMMEKKDIDEYALINRPIILFHFYDFLLAVLYNDIKDIESLDLPILAEVPSVKRLTRKDNNNSVSVSNNLSTGISKKNKNRGDK